MGVDAGGRRRVATAAAASVALIVLALFVASKLGSEKGVTPPREAEAPRPPERGPKAPAEPLPIEGAGREALPPALPEPAEPEPAVVAAETATAPLRVIVRDPWDRPVESGTVAAWPSDSSGEPVARVSFGSGAAVVRLPRGVPHRIEASPSRETWFGPASVEPAYSDWGEMILRLEANAWRISGRIVDAATGEPLLITAYAGYESPNGASGSFTLGKRSGEFDFLLPPGEVTFRAWASDRAIEERVFRGEAGEWVRDVEIPLSPLPRVSLEGRVASREGSPLAGARVSLHFVTQRSVGRTWAFGPVRLAEITTDGEGRFAFAEVPAGKLAANVSKEGFEPAMGAAFWVEREGEQIEFLLVPAGRLRVRGLAPDGSPVRLKRVALQGGGVEVLKVNEYRDVQRAVQHFSVRGTVTADGVWGVGGTKAPVDDGEFLAIEGIPPGEYRVAAAAEGREGSDEVVVAAGESVDLEIRLEDPRQ